MSRISLLISLVCLAFCNGQIVNSGGCPPVTPIQNFDIQRFSGQWYEISKYPFYFANGRCVVANYFIDARNNINITVNFMVNKQKKTIQQYASLRGTSGLWNFTIPSLKVESQYAIIATDYSNWAVTYACGKFAGFSAKMVWIISRTRTMSQEFMIQAIAALNNQNLPTQQLVPTDQNNCSN